jgi:hypothetical protein
LANYDTEFENLRPQRSKTGRTHNPGNWILLFFAARKSLFLDVERGFVSSGLGLI